MEMQGVSRLVWRCRGCQGWYGDAGGVKGGMVVC